jgi:hypothetical protein
MTAIIITVGFFSLLLGTIISLVATVALTRSATLDARKYFPQQFREGSVLPTVAGIFMFTPAVPIRIQKRYMIGKFLGSLVAAEITTWLLIIGKDEVAVVFGSMFLFSIFALVKMLRAYDLPLRISSR